MYGKAVNEINVVQNANDIMPNFYSVKTDLNNKKKNEFNKTIHRGRS